MTISETIADYVETYRPLDMAELVMFIQLRHNIPATTIKSQTYRMLRDGRIDREHIVEATYGRWGNNA